VTDQTTTERARETTRIKGSRRGKEGEKK